MTPAQAVATAGRACCTERTYRVIPSRFPPIPAFDNVAEPGDLAAVMELEGWTNDRLAAPRLSRLPQDQWVYGRANASVIMAAFLHGSPGGMRFSTDWLGAWYGADALETSILEVANGLRAELSLTDLTQKRETYRAYLADLAGDYVDIFGAFPEFHDPDPRSYPVPQAFGEHVRQDDPTLTGIRYQSVRHPGHAAWVCYDPRAVRDVVQERHMTLTVRPTGKVTVERH